MLGQINAPSFKLPGAKLWPIIFGDSYIGSIRGREMTPIKFFPFTNDGMDLRKAPDGGPSTLNERDRRSVEKSEWMGGSRQKSICWDAVAFPTVGPLGMASLHWEHSRDRRRY